jgi:hypothetical protein
MLEIFYPDAYMDSTYVIDFEKMYQKGIRGLIFDIDNTLVPHGAPADERAMAFFEKLRKIGFQYCFLSNNQKQRVASFQAQVGGIYIENAHKPHPANYRKAMERMGTDVNSTMFIGDQIFTDIYGARLAGIPSILVKPIHPKEEIQIVLKRILERIVLYFYAKRQADVKEQGHRMGGFDL